MSRNFGMKMLTMTNLSTECLIQLTKLGYDSTPFNRLLQQNTLFPYTTLFRSAQRAGCSRGGAHWRDAGAGANADRKSTRLNSSHEWISYAVFCLKKKKNQAVATSQEAVQNQNEPQLRDENAHNDKSVHGVLNPTYQAGLRLYAIQPATAAEYTLSLHDALPICATRGLQPRRCALA